MRANLEALPALYRALADVLQPGRRGGGPVVSGTPGSRMPGGDALDLRARGGIEGVVGGWARDLCERENWTIPDYTSISAIVDWACHILAINLPMICDEHPAVKEMAAELRKTTAQAERLITGEKPPRRITVTCSTDQCHGTMHVTLDTPGARCPACGEQYGHAEVLQLPMAERRAAA
jgi:hypothetical protein